MFELLDPGCNGVIPASKLDSIPLERYKEAFEYIIKVGDELYSGTTVGEWEEGELPPFLHGSDREGGWEEGELPPFLYGSDTVGEWEEGELPPFLHGSDTEGEWKEGEAPPFPHGSDTEGDADFMYFGEGEVGDHDHETAEYLEGEGGPATPPSQQKKEEL